MLKGRTGTPLRWMRATATSVFVAALCLAVALLVIALIPGSPVTYELPAKALKGLGSVDGVASGVAVDPSGSIPLTVHDPSLTQRLLHLLTVLPGVLVVAEIAGRLTRLFRTAQTSDPFTATTARALVGLGKVTASAGLSAWIVNQIAGGLLASTMLASGKTFEPHQTPLGWLALARIFVGIGMILDQGSTRGPTRTPKSEDGTRGHSREPLSPTETTL